MNKHNVQTKFTDQKLFQKILVNDNFGKHASYDMIGYPMGTRWLKLNLNETNLI